MNIDINKQETSEKTLDLNGYKHVSFEDIALLTNKIQNIKKNNNKKSTEIGKYWWISKDNKYIVTITTENPKFEYYELSKTTINFRSPDQGSVVESTKQSLLNNLTLALDGENLVNDIKEAEEKAKETDKKIFWCVSKDRYILDEKNKKKRSIVVLDFSVNINNPTITKYPLDIYTPKKTIEV